MGILEPIKGFTGLVVGATLGGAAIRTVAGIGAFSSGISSATQTFIGLGVLGHAAGTAKDMFKFKL